MVGDMFTNGFKATVSGLCSELSIAAQFQTSLRYTAHAHRDVTPRLCRLPISRVRAVEERSRHEQKGGHP